MENFYTKTKALLVAGVLATGFANAQCPAITCPANITVNADAGNCGAVVNYTAPVGTDPCGTTVQTFNYTGSIVTWTVPAGVTSVNIEARGAQGGWNSMSTVQAGLGAVMIGDFAVTPGQQLQILVGEQPSNGSGNGGGGGTFVVDMSNNPLIIAGGGGGSSQTTDSPDKHGQAGTAGGAGAAGGGAGGTAGSGGSIGASGFQSGAGGGLLTNGADGWTTGTGGFAFVNGGSGGPSNGTARGGFGGGGSGSSYVVGGGGGGYSGGGSGGNSTAGVGGGGGSFNAGTNQSNTGGVNTGHGQVTITYSGSSTVTTTLTAGLGSGATFPVGTTTETYTVDDGNGNTSSCSFTVTVVDNENPSIVCPSNISANVDAGMCSAVVTYTAPVGVDNCAGATTTLLSGMGSGSTFPVGTTTETYEVTDGAGNTATCSFDVTVVDNEDPSIVCPSNVSANVDAGMCSAVVTYTAPAGIDNCAGATTTLLSGMGSGSTFPVGTITETYEVTDGAGNTATCSFDVTVVDNEAPVLVCPANMTVNVDAGMCSAVVTYTTPVGTDNCSAGTTTLMSGMGSGSTFNLGTTTETYTVSDTAGNTTTCAFDITVVDNEAPSISCPSDVASCDPLVQNIAPVAVADNCGAAVTYTLTGATTGSGSNDASGTTFNIGTTTVWYIATDSAGNADTCSFDVTIHSLPVVTASAASTTVCVDDDGVVLTGTPANGTWTGTGVTGSSFSPGTAGTGSHVLTYSFTDTNGCSSTASVTVVVNACVGVGEQSVFEGLNVYPNPANNNVTIALGSEQASVEISIAEITGRVVKTEQFNSTSMIVTDISDLARGVYFLTVRSGNSSSIVKLVKN